MTQLPLMWQRLLGRAGTTCPRCDATHQHLVAAVAKLRRVLAPLNIEPVLELREIDESAFRVRPSDSNRIWISGKPMEEWLGAKVGSSPCCSVCGESPCRTVEVAGAVFEEIPESVILKAALIAASELIAPASHDENDGCRCAAGSGAIPPAAPASASSCCA